MNISFKTRYFYSDELRLLRTLKAQREKQSGSRIKFYHYIIAALVGAGSSYIASFPPDSFRTFLFGTIAVLSFGFIVFMSCDVYKQKKKFKKLLQELNAFIQQGTVDTCVIHAKRIALAEEYEDEGDLYIIEYDTDRLIYLWDRNYNLQRKFPCLDFEIYEDKFFKAYGRMLYSLSSRITPLTIDKKAKWNYMSKVGVPEHLQTENKNLDLLIDEYHNCL